MFWYTCFISKKTEEEYETRYEKYSPQPYLGLGWGKKILPPVFPLYKLQQS